MKYVWSQETKPGIPDPSHPYNPLPQIQADWATAIRWTPYELSATLTIRWSPPPPLGLGPCVVRKCSVFGVMQVKVQILVLQSNHCIPAILYFQHKVSTVITNEITSVNHLSGLQQVVSKGPFIIFNLFKNLEISEEIGSLRRAFHIMSTVQNLLEQPKVPLFKIQILNSSNSNLRLSQLVFFKKTGVSVSNSNLVYC